MLKNLTKNTAISNKIVRLNGVKRLTGLIGKDTPEALLIKTRFGIHTFFLKFPIDVVVINKTRKVVFLRSGIRPGSIVIWNIKYDTILELPQKSIKNLKIELGDILEFNL